MGNTPSDGKKSKGNKQDKPSKADKKANNKKVEESKLQPEDFNLISVLGRGSYGKVYLVEYKKDGKMYAMKVLKKQELLKRKQVLNTQTERKILEELTSPFLVTLQYAFQTSEKLYMVLTYCAGGELFFHLKKQGRFAEDVVRFFAAEMIMALHELHQRQIVYRDLKPENVLLDEKGHLRITDFGLAKEIPANKGLTSLCGTPEYLPPEIIRPDGQGYTFSVDYWALGTVLYELFTGLPPFYSQQLNVMYEKILHQPLQWNDKDPLQLSDDGKAFISGLLEKDPKKRLGMGGADEIRNHPWFKSIDWQKMYNKEIPSPFVPAISQHGGNVDDAFRKAPAAETPLDTSQQMRRVHFPDFTYKGQAADAPLADKDDWEKL